MKDDLISKTAAIDAVEEIPWYHQNKNGEMVQGANSAEHQAWYKAEDIYAAIEALPSAQPGWTKDVNDILAYLNGVVHPLVSPENWNVYSELYDMVSGLLKPWEGEVK